jgi:SP family sugar:H+ symporter-like MFS transporter
MLTFLNRRQFLLLLASYSEYPVCLHTTNSSRSGTTIFRATGLSDSFVTAIILGAVNFGMTIPGVYVVERFGRRRALITGGLWMFMCFMVFASVGHFSLDQVTPQDTPQAGSAMIVFACLFIAGYAMTWAPIVWAIIGELYPTRYRAQAMGLATASNWIWVCTSVFRTFKSKSFLTLNRTS